MSVCMGTHVRFSQAPEWRMPGAGVVRTVRSLAITAWEPVTKIINPGLAPSVGRVMSGYTDFLSCYFTLSSPMRISPTGMAAYASCGGIVLCTKCSKCVYFTHFEVTNTCHRAEYALAPCFLHSVLHFDTVEGDAYTRHNSTKPFRTTLVTPTRKSLSLRSPRLCFSPSSHWPSHSASL